MTFSVQPVALASILTVGAFIVAACGEKPAQTPAAPAASSGPVAAAAPALTLPVSINQAMVALVDHSSDPIFDAATKPPKTADEWRDLEYHANQMAISGRLIQMAGTGPNDAHWVADPEWKAFAEKLTAVGLDASAAARAKDAKAFQDEGNKLIDVCEGCHAKFKPDIPTMKILHKPDFPHKFD